MLGVVAAFLSDDADVDEKEVTVEEDLFWILFGDVVVFLLDVEVDEDADDFFWVEDEDVPEAEEDVFF